jgi:hypothetical protein
MWLAQKNLLAAADTFLSVKDFSVRKNEWKQASSAPITRAQISHNAAAKVRKGIVTLN